jgi:hypothetical protein
MAVKKERKRPKGHVECPQCQYGWVLHDEDGRQFYDACYHCGNTGWISDEQAFMNRVRGVAGTLAYEAVMRLKKGADSNPDGEGWAFHAAENMLHEHEYTQGRVWEYESRMMAVLEQMGERDRLLLEVLVDRLDPEGKAEEPQVNGERPGEVEEPEVNPTPPSPPKTLYLNPPPVQPDRPRPDYTDDDIPF